MHADPVTYGVWGCALLDLDHAATAAVKTTKGRGEVTVENRAHVRFWEIDAARGVAIVMMMTYHAIWHTAYAADQLAIAVTGFWLGFQKATGALFLLLVGVSVTIVHSRLRSQLAASTLALKFVKRGALIFAAGMVLTAGAILSGAGRLDFGVLHLIGASIVMAFPLLYCWPLALIVGIALIVVGLWLERYAFDSSSLVWLGLQPHSYYPIDYFPVAPWLGVVLLGTCLGRMLYPGGQRRWQIVDRSRSKALFPITLLGKYSLIVYFIHLPIVLAVLIAGGVIPVPSVSHNDIGTRQ